MAVHVQVQEHGSRRRCPYCHDELQQGQMSYRCPGCDAIYHSECARECAAANGRCAVLGCAVPVPRVAPAPERTAGDRLMLAAIGLVMALVSVGFFASQTDGIGFVVAVLAAYFFLATVSLDHGFSRQLGKLTGRLRRLFSRRRRTG